MKYAKGLMWLDECRIPFVGNDTTSAGKRTCNIFETKYESGGNGSPNYETNTLGRFTPNLLVCDDMLNDGSITQGTKTKVVDEFNKAYEGWGGLNKKKLVEKSDKGTNSRYYDLDLWFDKMLEKL